MHATGGTLHTKVRGCDFACLANAAKSSASAMAHDLLYTGSSLIPVATLDFLSFKGALLMSNENPKLPTIDLATLAAVNGGFWQAAALTAAGSLFGAGFAKGNGKGNPWRAARDVVDPRNKANWPRVLPVVGGVYSAGRLIYKGGEFLGRS